MPDSHRAIPSSTYPAAYILKALTLLRDDGNALLEIEYTEFHDGTFTCITGPSGAGKTSLLRAMAGLGPRYAGGISCSALMQAGIDTLGDCSSSALLAFRQQSLGLVFQQADLLVELSAIANASIAAAWTPRTHRHRIDSKAQALLIDLGISRPEALAGHLSGGEQQRVSVARALANEPLIVLADEPTASLDGSAARRTLAVLLKHTVSLGKCLIVCSHDPQVIEQADHHWHLQDGVAERLR